MKLKFHTLLLVLISFGLSSCFFIGSSIKGDGHVKSENREIGEFDKVDVSNGLDVVLIPDNRAFLLVEADHNLHDHIITEISGKKLEIYADKRIRWAESKKVYVHYLELEEIQSSSGAHISNENLLKGQHVEIRASSGSVQNLQIDATELDSKCSSGAKVFLSGLCKKADIKASSGAHFKGKNLSTTSCNADVSSGAHIWIDVQEQLDAEASSGGHVYYSGQPSSTTVKSSSGGSISAN